jgi:exonuclease SbcD
MKSLIIGDPHLGKSSSQGKVGIGSSLNSRVSDQIGLLEWSLDHAVELGVENIILTGDIFEDTKPAPNLIALFFGWLKKCQAYQVDVHIIMGNHDMIRSGSNFTSSLDIIGEAELDGIYVYKNIDTIFIDNTAFTMLPFRDRKSFSVMSNSEALQIIQDNLMYEIAGIPTNYTKVLIGHLALEGSIPVGDEIDDMSNELICPPSLFKDYNYVWMGHVHKPQVISMHPHIAHIGSMDLSNFGESDTNKHIVIFDCQTSQFTTEVLPTRPLKKISILVPPNTEDTTAYVIDELKKTQTNFNRSIIRLEVSLACPELTSVNKVSLEKFLTQQGVFNITGITESKKNIQLKKSDNSMDTKMDVASAIKTYAQTYVDTSMQASFIELSMEIYKSYKSEAKD